MFSDGEFDFLIEKSLPHQEIGNVHVDNNKFLTSIPIKVFTYKLKLRARIETLASPLNETENAETSAKEDSSLEIHSINSFVNVEQDLDEVDNDSSDGDYQPSNLSSSSDGSSDENEEANVSIERGDVSVLTINKEIPKIKTKLQDCQASCSYFDVSSSMTPKLNNYEQIVNSIENLTEAVVCKSKGDAVEESYYMIEGHMIQYLKWHSICREVST
ncbi:uncharacterized protein LOC136084518 [Hydra vulgaris]|uniref:Uncharacterized protein LOC136084518 n=1 Tax=Hydra vulgaris TaxID=6087 RepID=A0ABM4CG23_HYDVU